MVKRAIEETGKRRNGVDPKESARKLVSEWTSLFGGRLRSALLFGSVARGEAVAGVSDINVLLLIDRIDAVTLKQASATTRAWVKTSREAPLLFEADQWVRAADVFAIEIADMRDAHEVLHGTNALDACNPDESAMRLQAERELRGKLLQLQTGLLVAADATADVGTLLQQSLPSFTTYMRTVLRLAGESVPAKTPEVIQRATQLVGGNADAYQQVWEARGSARALKIAVDDAMVDAYYDTAEKLADYVDTLRR
jgi:predicted nucleotidyltransferase